MSDLTRFRDHCRRMAKTQHLGGCSADHPAMMWRPADERCPGCVSDADRALWAQLADEIDAYLAGQLEDGEEPFLVDEQLGLER